MLGLLCRRSLQVAVFASFGGRRLGAGRAPSDPRPGGQALHVPTHTADHPGAYAAEYSTGEGPYQRRLTAPLRFAAVRRPLAGCDLDEGFAPRARGAGWAVSGPPHSVLGGRSRGGGPLSAVAVRGSEFSKLAQGELTASAKLDSGFRSLSQPSLSPSHTFGREWEPFLGFCVKEKFGAPNTA